MGSCLLGWNSCVGWYSVGINWSRSSVPSSLQLGLLETIEIRVLDPVRAQRRISRSCRGAVSARHHGGTATSSNRRRGHATDSDIVATDEQVDQRNRINELGAAVQASGQAVQGTQQVTETVVTEVVQQVQQTFQQSQQSQQDQMQQMHQQHQDQFH